MRTFMVGLVLMTTVWHTSPVGAQSSAMKPFDLNMDRVKVNTFGGKLGDSRTYFVPSYNLVVSVHGSVWAQKGGAQAHGKFFVEGLTQPLMHALATKLQDDLVTQMLPAAESALRTAEAAYQSDRGGFLDLLDAQRSLLDLTLEHERLRAEAQMHRGELEDMVGQEL